MNRSMPELFPRALGGWISTALACAVCILAKAYAAQAGINVWTSHGPGTVSIRALAIDPSTPSTLYAGTAAGGGGVSKSTDGGAFHVSAIATTIRLSQSMNWSRW